MSRTKEFAFQTFQRRGSFHDFLSTSSNVPINVIERFCLYPYYHLDFPTKLRGVCEVKMVFTVYCLVRNEDKINRLLP